ncbi:hypothetical protein FLA_1743 [Filimonas lacunae]|nr:hypothetical protein FLA_1743 [Filimonas lacunae]
MLPEACSSLFCENMYSFATPFYTVFGNKTTSSYNANSCFSTIIIM